MLTCFICKKRDQAINNPATLFSHIKGSHKIKDISTFQCTFRQCWAKFSSFSSFQRHVRRCVARIPNDERESEPETVYEEIMYPEMYVYAADSDVLNFEKEISSAALELACSLCANMNSPRSETYATIAAFRKTYLPKIISGIQEIFVSRVRPEDEETVKHFIKAIESSFDDVRNECKLEATLSDLKIIAPLEKCEVYDTFEKQRNPRKKQRNLGEVSVQVFDVDGTMLQKRGHDFVDSDEDDETDEIEEHQKNNENSIIKGEVTLMPIEFQIKKVLELPNVYEKLKLNTIKIRQENDLNHFIKGKLWERKLQNYEPDQQVVPFHFYGDGAQVNNPLGPHAKSGEQQLNYYSFPTIPYEYQSRLENIFVAQFYPADNKEQNQRLGYVKSFVGKHCCRYCRMKLDDIRTNVDSVGAIRRNKENYDGDVATDNVTNTGIQEDSPFNRIPFFHVTESSGADLAHDLLEGTLHTGLSKSILHFITRKYFDVEYLNDQLCKIDFGEAEKGNLPTPITMKKLKSLRFKMTESEMFFFTHHFTFLVGDRVPDDDPVWQYVMTIIKFFDLCYLPKYNQEDFDALRTANVAFNQGMKDLFGQILQHKYHLGTHYGELTDEFGPLRYVPTIRISAEPKPLDIELWVIWERFEGKHKEIKGYAKNTNSRRNLSYSIGKKTQFKFAYRLLRGEGLEDRISITHLTSNSIQNKVYYGRLQPSTQLNEILSKEHSFARKVTLNGIIFSPQLWLPSFVNNEPRIYEVVDILTSGLNDITDMFAICKLYTKVTLEPHYQCYRVHMDSLQEDMLIVNINEFLSEHQHPVKIHFNDKKDLFRCKRF